MLVIERPRELAIICALYFLAGVLLIALRRLPIASLRVLSLTHALVDSVAIGCILWAAGGVMSGLGILLLLPVCAMALLASNRDAFFMAAIATLAILVQQILVQLRHGPGGQPVSACRRAGRDRVYRCPVGAAARQPAAGERGAGTPS